MNEPTDTSSSGVAITEAAQLDGIDFDKGGGLVPLIAQNAFTGEVLMLGYANREALERGLSDGEVWFFSRSRRRLWRKGETSGNVLSLLSLHADCDGDALVARVAPAGPTCHLGARSCFGARPTLLELADVVDRRFAQAATAERQPEAPAAGPSLEGRGGDEAARSRSDREAPTSYTVRLFADANLRLKKLAEEAAELALACAAGDATAAAEEAADLVYHTLVACRAAGVPCHRVLQVLAERRK